MGSSQTISRGSWTSARASATRCCCPTGKLRRQRVKPPLQAQFGQQGRCLRYRAFAGTPAASNGTAAFSAAVSAGSRLYCWKTNPRFSRRNVTLWPPESWRRYSGPAPRFHHRWGPAIRRSRRAVWSCRIRSGQPAGHLAEVDVEIDAAQDQGRVARSPNSFLTCRHQTALSSGCRSSAAKPRVLSEISANACTITLLLASKHYRWLQNKNAADADQARQNDDQHHGCTRARGDLPQQTETTKIEIILGDLEKTPRSSRCRLIEQEARQRETGIWRDPEFAVIQSSNSAELRRRDGRFVVVEGMVRRVGFARSRIYLELVPRDGPTIVVARKLESALAREGRPVRALVGQTIRARGALDGRFGPRIEVADPAMIEIARRGDAPGEAKPHP